MAPITHYILTRLDARCVRVDIYDATSYASRQVYVNNALVKETTSTSFVVPIAKNTKVDILGLSLGEAGLDLSDTLADTDGDKIELDLPAAFMGKTVRVYSDGGNGTIDFGKAIAEGTADNLVTVTIHGFGDLLLDEFGQLALDDFGDLDLNTVSASRLKLVITKRLANGTYRFALVNYNAADNFHAPYFVTKTIATRPDELEPYIVTYNAETDELTLSAGANEASGYIYKVYAAPWGDGKDAIDFSTPLATATTSPLVLTGTRGAETDGTRYLVVRKSAGTLEERNTNVVAFTISGGDWLGNVPAAPTHLCARIMPLNAVRLRWEYKVAGAVPDGFNVYCGTSAVDYTTVVKIVPYIGDGILHADLDPISEATRFAVRAFRGGLVEQNLEYTTVAPLVAPVVVTGTGTATWKEE